MIEDMIIGLIVLLRDQISVGHKSHIYTQALLPKLCRVRRNQ
jgi:hypothetical protein